MLAFVLVAIDVGRLFDFQSWARIGPTLIAAVALGIGTGWDRRSLGFALAPRQHFDHGQLGAEGRNHTGGGGYDRRRR